MYIATSLNIFAFFFFFNDTATTEIYTLSLHDALPIFTASGCAVTAAPTAEEALDRIETDAFDRSEEHTSELQSQSNLVCRLLLEKKKKDHEFETDNHTSTSTQCTRRCSHGCTTVIVVC